MKIKFMKIKLLLSCAVLALTSTTAISSTHVGMVEDDPVDSGGVVVTPTAVDAPVIIVVDEDVADSGKADAEVDGEDGDDGKSGLASSSGKAPASDVKLMPLELGGKKIVFPVRTLDPNTCIPDWTNPEVGIEVQTNAPFATSHAMLILATGKPWERLLHATRVSEPREYDFGAIDILDQPGGDIYSPSFALGKGEIVRFGAPLKIFVNVLEINETGVFTPWPVEVFDPSTDKRPGCVKSVKIHPSNNRLPMVLDCLINFPKQIVKVVGDNISRIEVKYHSHPATVSEAGDAEMMERLLGSLMPSGSGAGASSAPSDAKLKADDDVDGDGEDVGVAEITVVEATLEDDGDAAAADGIALEDADVYHGGDSDDGKADD